MYAWEEVKSHNRINPNNGQTLGNANNHFDFP